MSKTKKVIVFAVLALFVIWIYQTNVTVGTTHYKIESGRLPEAFNHFKIVSVSDLHNAKFGKDNGVIIRAVKEEKPDIIAITGDLVDYSKTDIATAEALVKELVKIAPCYYVTGNHEAWLGEKYNRLEKILLDASVTVLRDKTVKLTENNQTIQLAGLDDPDFSDRASYNQQEILENTLADMSLTDDYCVLLSHRPETFGAYVNKNIDLVLSGHAHGGQFRLPFIGGIIAPNQGFFPKYDAGTYTENNTTMIVSRGLGNSVIPVRFNNRPEIVSVELISEK